MGEKVERQNHNKKKENKQPELQTNEYVKWIKFEIFYRLYTVLTLDLYIYSLITDEFLRNA